MIRPAGRRTPRFCCPMFFICDNCVRSDGSINPKNKSIKVLAIAGGIVTAVSDTTAQEKVEMVCRTFDTRHDQPDFERFTVARN